jgi:hypothetical protein
VNGTDLPAALVLVAAIAVPVLLVWVLGPRCGDVDSLFRPPTDLGWPRGVQEEEPMRWRVELLGRGRERNLERGRDPSGRPGGAPLPTTPSGRAPRRGSA